MNPAALDAFLKGDLDNFALASTPGGIEAQELAGQMGLVASFRTLPIDMGAGGREHAEALGFAFGAEVDGLFVAVTPPAGWNLRATDHAMWSDILDACDRKRGAVFYKAAFYDRSAHGHWLPRYLITSDWKNGDRTPRVFDAVSGETVWMGEPCASSDWTAIEAQEEAGRGWLLENYPDYQNPAAYW